MWNTIIDPNTKNKVRINSKLGKNILHKYIKLLGGKDIYNCGDIPCKFFRNKKKIVNQKKDINNRDTIYDVIIIGGGAAGISAANNLNYNGKNVIILEARDRVGGRIHDINLPNIGKIPLGAAWLHHKGKYPILQNLLDYYKIEYMESDSLKNSKLIEIYTKNGKISENNSKKFSSLLKNASETIFKEGLKYPDKSVTNVIKKIIDDNDLPNELTNAFITRAAEHCGMNADIMPSREFDGWAPNGQFILNGFNELIDILSYGLNIELNTVVTKVDQKHEIIKVSTNNGIYYSKHIICTLPIGVLQSNMVTFFPKLPKNKIEAIKNMNPGNHEKLFLRFSKIFWNPDVYVFQYSADNNRGLFTQWYNVLYPAKGEKILYTNLSGPDIIYASKTNDELKDIAMNILRKMFKNVPEPEEVYMTRWSLDPYTMGGPYSNPKMKATMKNFDIIGRPVKNIHFAGVDTSSTVTETVEAALLSGIRASNEILQIVDIN